MEVAKVSVNGQVTLPIELRRKLGINAGDKVAFIQDGDKYIIVNSSLLAVKEAQQAFAGEAERIGLKNEDDVVALIREVRGK